MTTEEWLDKVESKLDKHLDIQVEMLQTQARHEERICDVERCVAGMSSKIWAVLFIILTACIKPIIISLKYLFAGGIK